MKPKTLITTGIAGLLLGSGSCFGTEQYILHHHPEQTKKMERVESIKKSLEGYICLKDIRNPYYGEILGDSAQRLISERDSLRTNGYLEDSLEYSRRLEDVNSRGKYGLGGIFLMMASVVPLVFGIDKLINRRKAKS